MKRVVPVIVVAVVVVGFVFKDRWLPRVVKWLSLAERQSGYLGYVEAETTYIAAPTAGRLVERPVERGTTIPEGAVVFRLDTAEAEAEVARREAAVAAANAKLADLQTGKRTEELEIIRAQRREAEASLRLAEIELKRASQLASGGIDAQERMDAAKSQADQLRARIEQLNAEEAVGELGGRDAELEEAAANVKAAEADLAAARVRLRDLAPTAPFEALVDDTFFEVGEWVGAGQTVASLLSPARLKLRFFVPEKDVARAAPGTVVSFSCDSCPPELEAAITYVAPRAEFTPPVIYSEAAREKLVFLVEAAPKGGQEWLRPGLPVDVARITENAR